MSFTETSSLAASAIRNKSNPWGSAATNEKSQETPAPDLAGRLARIVLEQESERRSTVGESEDDAQIRLAIEASLQEDPGAAKASNVRDEDIIIMDEDMRLALALSLSEVPPERDDSQILARRLQMEEEERWIDGKEAESMALAELLQQEANSEMTSPVGCRSSSGNVRTATRQDFFHTKQSASSETRHERRLLTEHDATAEGEDEMDDAVPSEGFRMNDNHHSSEWTRDPQDSSLIVGPSGEIRTKHDVHLKHRSNAERLLRESNSFRGKGTSIGDKAYNSFRQKQKKAHVKGVAAHGHGRAEDMSNDRTRGGALDGNARLLIQKAINSGLIDEMNGVVEEGKEAMVYHASSSKGDVAVKVFKRITEFKGRGKYVNGDPRFYKKKFGEKDKRDQVELWAEKEYRNLVRAGRAGVPTPTPLLHKKNILFMNFLGQDGWPSPKLRQIDIKHGSRKWRYFYCQVMVAVRKLYHLARLVHADLSEYNILICPQYLVSPKKEGDDLQAVLIDFGQAVLLDHPDATDLLKRDLHRLGVFFGGKGSCVLADADAMDFIVTPCTYAEEEEGWLVCDNVDESKEDVLEDEDFVVVKSNNESEPTVPESTIDAEKEESNDQVDEDVTWRHCIKGWSDDKDFQRLEEMLDQVKQG